MTLLDTKVMVDITETLRRAREKIEELELSIDLIIAERDSLRQELDFLKDRNG